MQTAGQALLRVLGVGLVALLLALPFEPACAIALVDVGGADGDYTETTDDMRVKVMGGYVTVARTWFRNQWYFNPSWAPLIFTFDNLDGSVKSITRAGWEYKKSGVGAFAFDKRNTILAIAAGWRWQNRLGDWIEYDQPGRIQAYGNRNNVRVSFSYDSSARLAGVLDHFGTQVLSYEYTGTQLTGIRDSTNRRVGYSYNGNNLTRVTDVLGNDWVYGYDAKGRITSRTDPETHTRSIAYALNGKVAAITEPDGARTLYTQQYDSSKRLLSQQIVYADGRVTNASYDLNGVLKQKDESGQTRMTVALDGRVIIRTDAAGNQTRDELDEWDNVVNRTYADGSTETFEREPMYSNVTRHVDPNANTTVSVYDSRGNLARLIEASGRPETRTSEFGYDELGNRTQSRRLADLATPQASFSYVYDRSGNPTKITDPEANTTGYSYDVQGNLTVYTDGRGKVWTNSYDNAGRLLAETDPIGNTRRYDYDKVGNLRSSTDARGKVTRFEYDARSRLISTIDPFGKASTVGYDAAGLPILTTDADGRQTHISYDPLQRLASARDDRGNEIRMEYPEGASVEGGAFGPNRIVYPTFEKRLKYDKRNRIAEESNLLGTQVRPTQYGYDKNGNRTATTAPDGKTVRLGYDALDRRIQRIDTLGNITALSYDNRDNAVAVTDASNHVWRFEYDRANRMTKEVTPRGEETVYRYDANGNVVETLDAVGQRIEYAYDDAGRVTTRLEFPAGASQPGKTVTYTHDEESNLVAWSDATQASSLAYDDLNRLSTETVDYGAMQLTYAYQYHANGLKKSVTYPGGQTYAYSYAEDNELSGIEIPNEGSISVNELLWSAPKRITLPGGSTQEFAYDGLLSPTSIKTLTPAGQVAGDVANRYGSLGQLLEKTVDGADIGYSYDDEVRVTAVTRNGQPEQDLSYDAVDNRLTDSQVSGRWEYDENNRLLRKADDQYEYDANGNLARKVAGSQVTRYFYDVTDRLIRVEDGAGGVIARYGYDPGGRRLWKQASGSTTYFLHADEGLIGEYNALGEEIRAYGWRPDGGWGTDPVFLKVGSRYFYYHNDHLGTPLKLIDRNGAVAWSATYTAFGSALVSPASTLTSNLRFPGQYFDSETGLHYNYFRYYDPAIGRYTQPDPIGLAGGTNQYAYVRGNPVGRTDSSGLIVDTIVDVGFILYDIYLLGAENIFGKCDNLGTNLAALGGDIVGAAIPGVTGLGAGIRAAKKASNVAKNSPIHHICTNKNCVSDISGGPWTPRFEALFQKAGMHLEDALNKVAVPGHQGPHPEAYHQAVFDRLASATNGLSNSAYRDALQAELRAISAEVRTPGSVLNNVVTKP